MHWKNIYITNEFSSLKEIIQNNKYILPTLYVHCKKYFLKLENTKLSPTVVISLQWKMYIFYQK